MQHSLREETEGKLQMLLSPGKNGQTSLFKEVRVFKVGNSIFWDLGPGSKFPRQESEMTLPRGSGSDLPFSLKSSWELVCLRTARSLLQTLPRRLSQNPSSNRSRSQ